MAVHFAKLTVAASTLETNGKFRGYWHVYETRPDNGEHRLRDQPVPGTFASDAAARAAAIEAGSAYAQDILEKNPHLRDD